MSETTEDRARAIFSSRASYYTTSSCHRDPEVLGIVVGLARPELTWRVLDVGTGTGHTAFALAPHVREVVGIDITPEMLVEARKLQVRNKLANVRFEVADAHALPYANESFDLVTCRRAAHHFSRIETALSEFARVLRRGGRLIIDDRSVPEDEFVAKTMNRLDWYHDESHVREYSPAEWQHLLTDMGFKVEELRPYLKHRPISSLTDNVSEKNVRAIYDIINSFTEDQRASFNLVEKEGTLYFNHWYVTVAAVRT